MLWFVAVGRTVVPPAAKPSQSMEGMFYTVSNACRPIYDALMADLKNSAILGADETGWFLIGKNWWVWVFVSNDSTVYHISPSRSGAVPEAILEDFTGILLIDSYGAHNKLGGKKQKCLLHYFREMNGTRAKNKSAEYGKFFDLLHDILKDSIAMWLEFPDGTVPEKHVQDLLFRVDALVNDKHADADCKRFVKRLRRERDMLFTFLRHPIEYHNNRSERALRIFAILRKIQYGNRSLKGVEATEKIASIMATCRQRGINPYRFLLDLLNGGVDSIPMPEGMSKAKSEEQAACAITA